MLMLGSVILALALCAGVAYYVLPKAADMLGFNYHAPFLPKASPPPTPVPTPTPHPITYYEMAEHTQEVVFDGSANYKWFTDPYFYGGKLILSAGKLDAADNSIHMLHLYFYDPATSSAEALPFAPQNTHFMFPKFNDKWLVYLDANANGGGALMAVDRAASPLKPVKIKDIYAGQPEPMLDGNYVAFTDRTGTNRDKLFICDLTTMESTVVAMFSNAVYGESRPSLWSNWLLWASPDTSGGGEDSSVISYIHLAGSPTISSYLPGGFVHDPKTGGKYTAWLTDVHSGGSQLYATRGISGTPFLIDSGVVDFGIGSDFVAYSRGQSIYLYLFETSGIYRITQDYESAQFLGVSDDRVIWMDVTSRERDIIKFIAIP